MRRRIRSLSARSRLSERIGHSSCWTAQRQPARALCGSTRTSGATCVAGHQVLTRYSRCRPRASVATVLRRTVCIASCTRSSGSLLWTISDGLCSAGNLLLNDRPAWTVDVRPAAAATATVAATELGSLCSVAPIMLPEAIHLRVLATHRYSCVPDRGVRADVHRTAEHRRTPHVGRDKTLQRSIIYCNTVQRSQSCAP